MRHQLKGKGFGRNTNQRKRLIRSLIFELVDKGGLVTTDTKAKVLRREFEKMVNFVKKDKLDPQKRAYKVVPNKTFVDKLMIMLPNIKDKSGMISLVKMGIRKGDNAKVTKVSLKEGILPNIPNTKEKAPEKEIENEK